MATRARFFCVLFSILFILSLVYSIAWIYVAMGSANPGVRVDTASSLDSFTLTNTTKLSAEWNFKLLMLKPNHGLRVSYHAFHAQVFYKDHHDIIFLNTSTLQSFFNSTSSMVHMSLKADTYVGSYVAEGLDLSRRSHGMLEFGITLSISFRYKSHSFLFFASSKSVKVCHPLRFSISPGFLLEGITCTEPPLGLE